MTTYKFKKDYNSSFIPSKYGDKGLMLYALALKHDVDDVDSLAASSLTDNVDDKGIDILHFLPEQKTAIIVQGYMAEDETKPAAKSSKASDFNSAISWALSQTLDKVPEAIRVQVSDLRSSIKDDEINHIEFWYVHNLDESENVKKELDIVKATAKSLLQTHFPEKSVSVSSLEVGNNAIEDWYRNKTQTIMVDDEIEAQLKYGGYEIKSKDWKAFDTTVSLKWLHGLYKEYGTALFSANIRGYLGSKSQDINNSIKESCSDQPGNFWVYNNGITCLVHEYSYDEPNKRIVLKGISVVNGAQTTGAVGSIEIPSEGFVPARFVASDKREIWQEIILFNNSQNRIFSYDFRSNDEIQKRLRNEFDTILGTDYTGRRGGAEDIVKRNPNLIGTEKAGISLVAFHGNPHLTYHKKSQIWYDENYGKYYNSELTAKHLVFTYSLYVAIQNKKDELRDDLENLTGLQEEEYKFFRKRGGMRLYLSAIGQCMEEILNQKIPNPKKLSFGNVSWKQAVEYWKGVVDLTVMYYDRLLPGVEFGILKEEYVKSSIADFKKAIASQVASEPSKYDSFKEKIKMK
ncbi:MAG: AIPR family protein [Candidatus Bathyarchaeota archaeon]|nr:AIPR family protein [Candidatus Bathyarchaeota archaeon]